jgi:hypothetical protein
MACVPCQACHSRFTCCVCLVIAMLQRIVVCLICLSASCVHLILQLYIAAHEYSTMYVCANISSGLQDADVAPMEDDAAAAAAADGEGADAGSAPGPSQLPEVELYSYLLLLVYLLDRKQFTQVRCCGIWWDGDTVCAVLCCALKASGCSCNGNGSACASTHQLIQTGPKARRNSAAGLRWSKQCTCREICTLLQSIPASALQQARQTSRCLAPCVDRGAVWISWISC